jgi:hypothetical protein
MRGMLRYITMSHLTYLEEEIIGVCCGSEVRERTGPDRKRRSKRNCSKSRALDRLWYRTQENALEENEGALGRVILP